MLSSADSLEPRRWVEQVWRREDLAEPRLYRRLVLIVAMLLTRLTRPTSSLSRALRRGGQRFWNNEAVNSSLLARRCSEFVLTQVSSLLVVLLLHDSMEVDLHGRHCPDDAGPLRSSHSKGYLTHNTVVCVPGKGLLGLLCSQVWTRSWLLKQQNHKQRSASEKESRKWRVGVRRAALALRSVGSKAVAIHVMDREADDYLNFTTARRHGDLVIIRATQDRNISEGPGKLWAHVLSQRAHKHQQREVEVTANKERREQAKKAGKEALAKFDARVAKHGTKRKAELQLRYSPVTVHEPQGGQGRVAMNAVCVSEVNAPEELEAVEWMLLTTCPVSDEEGAKRVVGWYAARWGVEEFHKVSKHGLNLEKEVVEDVEAFKREWAVVATVATQLMRWRALAREEAQQTASEHVDEETLKALKEASRFHGLPLPRRVWTLKDVMSRLALLGGYEPRKGNEPGWLVLWRGWGELERFWATFSFAQARVAAGDS